MRYDSCACCTFDFEKAIYPCLVQDISPSTKMECTVVSPSVLSLQTLVMRVTVVLVTTYGSQCSCSNLYDMHSDRKTDRQIVPLTHTSCCLMQDDEEMKKHDLQRALVQKQVAWYKNKYW